MDGMMNKHALHSHDLTAQLNSQQHVLKCCLNDRLTNVIEDQTREDHDKNKYKMLLQLETIIFMLGDEASVFNINSYINKFIFCQTNI